MEEYRQLGQLIDLCTAENVSKPEISQFIAVAEAIRSRSDMPKEAVKIFQKKLATKNTKALMLTLELIEFCTLTCEINLHTQFSTKDFLLRLGSILNNNKDIEPIVKKRILALIRTWYNTFQKDLHQLFYNFYENVESKGMEIPVDYESSYKSYRNTVQSKPSPQKQQINYRDDDHDNNDYSTQSKQPYNTSSQYQQNKPSISSIKQPKETPQTLQKLRDNIKIMEQNMDLINNLIDEHRLGSPVQSNETLFQLAENLDSRAEQFQQLIGKIQDEGMLQYTIQVNDILLKTLERYKALKRGQKPPPLNPENEVEEEILEQIRQLELQEKIQQINQQKTSAQQFGFEFQPPSNNNPNTNPNTKQEPIQKEVIKQKPQQMVENLIDLFDDNPTESQTQKTHEKQPPKQTSANIDLFEVDLMVGSQPQVPLQTLPQQQQQQIQQIQQTQQNVWNQFNSTAQNNFQQQQSAFTQQVPFQQQAPIQQQNKYSALEAFNQPQYPINNGFQQFPLQQQPFQSNVNPQQFQSNVNPQQFQSYVNPQQFQSQQFNPHLQQQQQQFGNNGGQWGQIGPQSQQRPQQPINGGFVNPQFQSTSTVGGASNKPSQFLNAGQSQIQIKESSPFDDLDDMFGIKVPAKGNNSSGQSQVQSQKQQQPVQSQQDNKNKNLFDDLL